MSAYLSNDRRRHLRLPVIDRHLQIPGSRWSAQQLLEKVNTYLAEGDDAPVTIRTIQKDLKYLEALPHNPAPIGFTDDGRVRYYFYTDRFYELESPVVNTDQVFALTLAHEVLGQLKGFPMAKEVEALKRLLDKQLASVGRSSFPIILFENTPALIGIEKLEPLFEAIREHTVLAIQYQPYGLVEGYEKIIHPWWLKQSNQRWFLFGWDEQLQRLDNSPLDRIAHLKPVSVTYKINTGIDPMNYFKPIVGVTRKPSDEMEELRIKVSARRANYIATKPIHESQTSESVEESHSIFSYQLIINEELISRLLSFGPDVEVLKPQALREKIHQTLIAAKDNYPL